MTTHFIREGYLQRVNANRLSGESAAICPYSRDGDNCGDWCALFHQETNAIKLECAGVRIQVEKEMPKEEKKDKFDPENYHSANPDHPVNRHPNITEPNYHPDNFFKKRGD